MIFSADAPTPSRFPEDGFGLCQLLRGKQTFQPRRCMSANDPSETSAAGFAVMQSTALNLVTWYR